MKIKLPFTEEFLWDIYNMIEGVDKSYDFFAPKTFKEVLCPDLFRLRKHYQRREQRRAFSNLIWNLKARGYLREKRLKNQRALVITIRGMERISKIFKKKTGLLKRKDGKFQMIMYDVPEERRKDRDYLRNALLPLGYSQLQKSIWISPYNVFEQTQSLIHDYSLTDYVRLFLIEEETLRD